MPGTPTAKHGIATMVGASDLGQSIDDTYNSGVATIDAKMASYDSGAALPAAGTAGRIFRNTTDGTAWLDMGAVAGWLLLGPRTLRVTRTYAVQGEIRIPSGNADVIPPFHMALASGQAAKLIAIRHRILVGTQVTYKVQRNGADIAGGAWTGLTAEVTEELIDPADVALADGDRLQPVVTQVSGTPQNMTLTFIVEHTF